jgi:hypothetical protein
MMVGDLVEKTIGQRAWIVRKRSFVGPETFREASHYLMLERRASGRTRAHEHALIVCVVERRGGACVDGSR